MMTDDIVSADDKPPDAERVFSRAMGIARPSAEEIEHIRQTALEESFPTYAWWVPELQLLAEIDALREDLRLTHDAAADMEIYIARLEARNAAGLRWLRDGYYQRAADALEGKD